MFCPRCGANQGESRKFCTVCGTNLQIVAQALTGQLPQANDPPTPVQPQRYSEMSKGITQALVGFGFLTYQIVNSILSAPPTGWRSPFNFWSLIAFVVLAAGIAKIISSRVLTATQHPPAAGAQPQQGSFAAGAQPALPQPVFSAASPIEPSVPRTNELEPVRQPVLSVIEEETRSLPRRTSPQELSR